MTMIKFGDYYINPKHVGCCGINDRLIIEEEKFLYEVFVICQGQKISMICKARSEAEELVQQIRLTEEIEK